MGAKLSVLGQIVSFPPYLRSAMVRFPFQYIVRQCALTARMLQHPVLGELKFKLQPRQNFFGKIICLKNQQISIQKSMNVLGRKRAFDRLFHGQINLDITA